MSDLSHLALPGATLAVRVPPGARRAEVVLAEGAIRISVTALTGDRRATEAARAAPAEALGVAKRRLELVRGAITRDKLHRLRDQPGVRSSR